MSQSSFYINTIAPLINGDELTVIEFLMGRGALRPFHLCSSCNITCVFVKYVRNVDMYAWRCMTKTCQNYKKYFSLRQDSIFCYTKLDLRKLVCILWKWSQDHTQKQILLEVDISHSALYAFIKTLQKACINWFIKYPILLGGSGVICQIDESLFRHKTKYHRGRAPQNEKWVFGIADVSFIPAKIYLQCVDDRSQTTLVPIILQVCRPNTIVISDQWRAYANLNLFYEHLSVNHSLNFVDPTTLAHTQNIESYWGKAKMRAKIMKGVDGNCLELYLNEWMWKDNEFKRNYNVLFELIKI